MDIVIDNVRARRYTSHRTYNFRNDNNYYHDTSDCILLDALEQMLKAKPAYGQSCMEFAINVPVFHFNDRSCLGFAINSGFVRCHS